MMLYWDFRGTKKSTMKAAIILFISLCVSSFTISGCSKPTPSISSSAMALPSEEQREECGKWAKAAEAISRLRNDGYGMEFVAKLACG